MYPICRTGECEHHRRDIDEEATDRREDLRRIIANTVLPTPLLQQEDEESDIKPHKVPLPEECLLQPQSLAGLSLLPNLRFDLRVFMTNGL